MFSCAHPSAAASDSQIKKRNVQELKRLHHAVSMSRAFFSRADTRKKWITIGGIEALVHAARTWLHHNAAFLGVALRALGYMSCDASINARVAHAGGLEICKETIATYAIEEEDSGMARLAGKKKPEAEHVRIEACVEAMYVFSRFTLRPAECHAAMGADVVEASLAAMRHFEHSADVSHWGVVVLTNVAAIEVKTGKDAGKPKYWEMLNAEHAHVCVEYVGIRNGCCPRCFSCSD